MIVELPFASELIHLTEWKQILNVLKDRDMYDAVKELVKPYCIIRRTRKRKFLQKKQHQIITKTKFVTLRIIRSRLKPMERKNYY